MYRKQMNGNKFKNIHDQNLAHELTLSPAGKPEQNSDRKIILYNGYVYSPWESIYGGVVISAGIISSVFEGELPDKLTRNTAKIIDCKGNKILPGFIDLHLHGAKGFDFTLAAEQEISRAVHYHAAKGGTTALVPTIVSAPLSQIKQAAERIRRVRAKSCKPQILGVHLEGPFLNPLYKGAHSEEYLQHPRQEIVEDLAGSIGEDLAIVTLSPELPHALEAIAYLSRQGIVAALGHSGATVEEVQGAVDCGLRHAVHTYSAMRRFHHRSPGALGAVLTIDNISAEIIADGIHSEPAAVKLFFRAKPAGKTVLVTDALAVCGLPDRECKLGDKTIISKGGKALLQDGTLAGSILTMNRALEGAVKMTELGLTDVLPAATINPARTLGLTERKGSLEAGKDADITVLDADYNALLTVCRGNPVIPPQ